jgi:PAS domain S-box-containing protein
MILTNVLLYRCKDLDIKKLQDKEGSKLHFITANTSSEIKENILPNETIIVLGKGEEAKTAERLFILYPYIYIIFLTDEEGEKRIMEGLKGSLLKRNRLDVLVNAGEEEIIEAAAVIRQGGRRKETYNRIVSVMNKSINDKPVYKSQLKDYLDELLEHAPIGVVAISAEGEPDTWNKRAIEIIGKNLDEVKHISDIFSEEINLFLENSTVVKDNHLTKIFHLIIDYSSFKSIEVTATPIAGSTGNKGFLLIIQDVTERELTQDQLRQSNERLKRAEETSLVMITHIGLDGRWIKVTGSFANYLGYSEEELHNLNLKEITHPDDISADWGECEKLISGEKTSYEIQKRYIRKDGAVAWVYLNRSIVRDEQNNPLYFLTFVIDITEQKRNEELILNYTRELKELNASKDKLFSIISHDLKSPLHSILNLSQMIVREEGNLNKEVIIDIANGIAGSTSHLIALLENLLEWSRFQSGRIEYAPEVINLREAAEFVINIIGIKALTKEIKLINEIEENSFGYADKKMIISVLQNLMTNAIKFTNKQGLVKISSKEVGEYVHIDVKDNGVGMDNDTKIKIFTTEANISTAGTDEERGTGLGLIITRDFVKKNGGTIMVDSEPGKGTCITFTVPRSRNSIITSH